MFKNSVRDAFLPLFFFFKARHWSLRPQPTQAWSDNKYILLYVDPKARAAKADTVSAPTPKETKI